MFVAMSGIVGSLVGDGLRLVIEGAASIDCLSSGIEALVILIGNEGVQIELLSVEHPIGITVFQYLDVEGFFSI